MQLLAGGGCHHPDDFFVRNGRQSALMNRMCRTSDLGGLIAHPFKIGDDFDRRHDRSQVVSRRLAFDNQVRTGVIECHLHLVDFDISGNDALSLGRIERTEARHRIIELLLHQTAHLKHARAYGLQIQLILSGRMFGHVSLLAKVSASRQCLKLRMISRNGR